MSYALSKEERVNKPQVYTREVIEDYAHNNFPEAFASLPPPDTYTFKKFPIALRDEDGLDAGRSKEEIEVLLVGSTFHVKLTREVYAHATGSNVLYYGLEHRWDDGPRLAPLKSMVKCTFMFPFVHIRKRSMQPGGKSRADVHARRQMFINYVFLCAGKLDKVTGVTAPPAHAYTKGKVSTDGLWHFWRACLDFEREKRFADDPAAAAEYERRKADGFRNVIAPEDALARRTTTIVTRASARFLRCAVQEASVANGEERIGKNKADEDVDDEDVDGTQDVDDAQDVVEAQDDAEDENDGQGEDEDDQEDNSIQGKYHIDLTHNNNDEDNLSSEPTPATMVPAKARSKRRKRHEYEMDVAAGPNSSSSMEPAAKRHKVLFKDMLTNSNQDIQKIVAGLEMLLRTEEAEHKALKEEYARLEREHNELKQNSNPNLDAVLNKLLEVKQELVQVKNQAEEAKKEAGKFKKKAAESDEWKSRFVVAETKLQEWEDKYNKAKQGISTMMGRK